MTRRILEVRYDVTGLPEWEVDGLESEAQMIAEASSDYTECASALEVDESGAWGHRSIPAPSVSRLEDDDRTERVSVFLSVWNAQRVRDLLFTLRDLDDGENVGADEIAYLASMFPELPSDFGGAPVEGAMLCADCGREVEAHPSGLCDSCETQAHYDAAAEAHALEVERMQAAGYVAQAGQAGWGVRSPIGFWVADGYNSEAEAWAAASDAARSWPLAPGSRVRLRHDVERFPHFVAPAGATGTVVDDVGDALIFAVRMDAPIPGAEDWENEVHWVNGDDPREDLERADAPTPRPSQDGERCAVCGEWQSSDGQCGCPAPTTAAEIRERREARGMADPLNRMRARNAERIASDEAEAIVEEVSPALVVSVVDGDVRSVHAEGFALPEDVRIVIRVRETDADGGTEIEL